MEAISAVGLTKKYGDAHILDSAALAVEEGSRVVVFGPTGCGKSTLLLILAGLVRADSGLVRLFGTEASGNGVFLEPEERRMGVVFQKPVLWPHMNAAQNVEFALYPLGLGRSDRRARALAALERFGAAELATRRPETLSGGQAQRVALARSIVARPRILLWDEPFTGLDAATRDEVAAAAVELLRETATTLVAVSHHAADAEALSAGALFLKDGKLNAK